MKDTKEKQPHRESPAPSRNVPNPDINETKGTGHYVSREAQSPGEEQQQHEAEQAIEQDEENPLADEDALH